MDCWVAGPMALGGGRALALTGRRGVVQAEVNANK